MSISAYAQSVSAAQVPSLVKKAMMTKFPKATDVEWEKENEHFLAQFSLLENWTVATFNDKGVWIQTNASIATETIPAAVTKTTKSTLPGCEILSANRITSSSSTTYLVQAAMGDSAYELTLKADGTLVKKEMIEEEEEDDEEYEDDNEIED